MLNRPEDHADALVQDNDDINGAATTEPDTRPLWKRHFAKFTAGAGAALMLGLALIPTGHGAFAIEPGQGIIRPGISFEQSIDLAQHCNVPVYMGRIQTDTYRIGYDAARLLETETDRTQVTAGVRTGDRFNYRRNIFGAWASDACPPRPPQFF